MTNPVLSVVVCTRNRARWLEGCLASLDRQAASRNEFEVVVVDNGSRDDTAAVVASFSSRASMPVRYFYEARAGVARARNVGIASARASVVGFLDDDARARPDWVDVLCSAFARAPHAAVIGGPIVLAWPQRSPEWMTPALEGWFSGLDLGPEFRELGPDESLYGTNLAMRRDLAVAAGGFDPRLGRVGRRLRSGEDWDIVERLRRHGAVCYEPGAVVDHDVLPERLRLLWFLRRCYAFGRNSITLRSVPGAANPRRVAEGLAAAHAMRSATRAPLRLVRTARRKAPDELMIDLSERAICAGEAVAALGEALRIRARPAVVDPQGFDQPVGRGARGSSQ